MFEDESLSIKSSSGVGKHRVDAIGIVTREGIIVCILGGDKPHVGAVALGIPRYSLRNSKVVSGTVSVLTVTGHKDDEIAKPIAEKFTKKLNNVTVVIAGVHVDKADKSDIAKLILNSTKAADELIKDIKAKI